MEKVVQLAELQFKHFHPKIVCQKKSKKDLMITCTLSRRMNCMQGLCVFTISETHKIQEQNKNLLFQRKKVRTSRRQLTLFPLMLLLLGLQV